MLARDRPSEQFGLPFLGHGRVLPILSKSDELTTIKQAAHHARRSERVVRHWCREYGIGRQSGTGATYEVNAVALEMVLHGDWPALEALRAGDRGAPEVARYFNHLGLAS